MTVGKATSTVDCEIHWIEDQDQTKMIFRIGETSQGRGSNEPVDIKWNIGPNLTLKERKEMLDLCKCRDVFATDMSVR